LSLAITRNSQPIIACFLNHLKAKNDFSVYSQILLAHLDTQEHFGTVLEAYNTLSQDETMHTLVVQYEESTHGAFLVALLQGMHFYHSNESVMIGCCALLGKLLTLEGLNHTALDKSIMMEFLTALEVHVPHAQILRQSCWIMNKLTLKQVEKMVVFENIEKCLLFMQALEIHRADAVVIETVCTVLHTFTSENERVMKRLGAAGLCYLLYELLRLHAEKESVVESICWVMSNFVVYHALIVDPALKVNGFDVVVRVFQEHQTSAKHHRSNLLCDLLREVLR
jgi:hypothetical protein